MRLGRREAVAAVALAVAAAWTTPIGAQLGSPTVITAPGSVTSDQPVEQATTDLDTRQLPPIVVSVTTTTAGEQYQPNSRFISSLDQALWGGINAQNAGQLMPVTQGLPCISNDLMLQIAATLAHTYQSVIADTQQQMTELESEDFSTIAANLQAPALLAVMQGVGQAVLADVQEHQYERQQLATLTLVVTADKLHQLDANVRSKLPREGTGC